MTEEEMEKHKQLWALMSELKVMAIDKGNAYPGIYLSWIDILDRVYQGLADEALTNGGTVAPVDGGSVILRGEFNLTEIVRVAVLNQLQTEHYMERVAAATREKGFPVCIRCRGEGKVTVWLRRWPTVPPLEHDQEARECLVCEGTGHARCAK